MTTIVIIIDETEKGGPDSRPAVKVELSPIQSRKPWVTTANVIGIVADVIGISTFLLALYNVFK